MKGSYYKNIIYARAAARLLNGIHCDRHSKSQFAVKYITDRAIQVTVYGQVNLETDQRQSLSTITRAMCV